jgi:energy-coupling factor transporter ATP-binding protein EcfA2
MTSIGSSKNQTTPLHEILKWSIDRPEWQRDALRRIIETGNLDNAALLELEHLSRSKITIDAIKPVSITADPLRAEHLPSAPNVNASVSLISIGDLQNVNRLADGSTIPFGDGTDLTVIYGENGAGKSGYARVIKKACRARGVSPKIMSNVFSSTVLNKSASAKIEFIIDSLKVDTTWNDGVCADSRLANVFVFDSFTADHYVREDDTAAFTPYGLDVLPLLSKTCDTLLERLKSDIAQRQAVINETSVNLKCNPSTEVGKCIQKLSDTTEVVNINALASLDAKQSIRMTDLREVLKADPLQKAKETRATISRIEFFINCAANIINELADDEIETAKIQLETTIAAESTAKAFAAGQFDASFLTGTGSELWRAMWEAARSFANTETYPNQPFPVLSEDARCILCQQELSDDGRQKLSRFDDFCKDTSQQLSVKAEDELFTMLNKLNSVFLLSPELEKIDADLALLNNEQRALISEFASNVDFRLKQLKQNLHSRNWVTPPNISAIPEIFIRNLIIILEARAKTEESANDPEIRKKLEIELLELEEREWLSSVKANVLEQIERFKIITELKRCETDLKTASITSKSKDLTNQFVTEAFKRRFKEELKTLGLNSLDVDLEAVQGKKAETRFGLRLVSAGCSKLIEIASEGEQRCIALAAFLSELSQASHQSALVFDDPVSSLDYWHREKIAKRLVTESKQRQVIIFTHDVVFLTDLLAFAEETNLTPNVLTLELRNNVPGQYLQGLPWDRKNPKACLTELERDQKTISANWNSYPNSENIRAMRHAYSLLRSTLERIVESELLSGVICRFKSKVDTSKLESLIGITNTECDEIKRLLKKCHQLTEAHDPGMNTIPAPADLMQDITATNELINTIKQRKRSNSK